MLEGAEAVDGAELEADEAGFVAVEEGEGARVVGEGTKGEGGAGGFVDGVAVSFQLRVFGVHFIVQQGGLHGAGAALAPLGGCDLLDQVHFAAADGLEQPGVFPQERAEGGGVFIVEDDGAGGRD